MRSASKTPCTRCEARPDTPRRVAILGFMLTGACACATAAGSDASWDMESLLRTVQPMQHSLNGFLSLRPQSLPIPTNDEAVRLRNTGLLRKYVDELWARGIAATVQIGGNSDTDAGAIATALTLQEAGVPIHVWTFEPGEYGGAAAFWPKHATPNAWWTNSNGTEWPAFPLATPTAGYEFIKKKLRVLKDNEPGIRSIAGLWMDYEGHPHYWYDMPASSAQRT